MQDFLTWTDQTLFVQFISLQALEGTTLQLYVWVRFEDHQAASIGFLWATSGNITVQRRAALPPSLPPFLIRILNPLPPLLLSSLSL